MSGSQHKEQDKGNPKQKIFSESLREPILGKHFKLPGRSPAEEHIKLDTNLSYIPVYNHLKTYDAELLSRPPTPPAIKRIESEEYMDFYTTQKK